jgi:predicted RNA binding protein YcfA (HicA-like mRNA interferase family)
MTKLPSLSTTDVMRALRRVGFIDAPSRGKGSHHALTRTDSGGIVRLVIVPERKDIPIGTLSAILRQAGLTRDELLALL